MKGKIAKDLRGIKYYLDLLQIFILWLRIHDFRWRIFAG